MQVTQAILKRRSIRAYKPDPVPRQVVEELLEAAVRAPSNSNTQPWRFYVVTGEAKASLDSQLLACVSEGRHTSSELRESEQRGDEGEAARLNGHRTGLVRELMKVVTEKKLPLEFLTKGSFRFFGAPVAIVVTMDRSQGEGVVLSIGAAVENLLLAAVDRGIGTCWIALTLSYSREMRSLLAIPESERIITSLALGYPDENSPLGTFQSTRDPLESRVRWIGW